MEVPFLHLGILPHKNINAVVDIVSKYFHDVPFWAQLPNYAPIEGRFQQYLTNIPGVKTDLLGKMCYLDTKSYLYRSRSISVIKDYDDISLSILKNYRPNSVFFDYFLRIIDEQKPKFAKGQIMGPLSLGVLLRDDTGMPVIENRKAMDIIIKSVCMQIISQICEMKTVSPAITPYIFVEEPEITKVCQPGTSMRSKKKVLTILKSVANSIKENGGIPVFHSNNCLDWSLPIDAGFEVLSFNAETQFVTILNTSVKMDRFLNSRGKLAWGVIPANPDDITHADSFVVFSKYMECVSRLKTFYKLHKSLILNHSIVTVGMNSEAFTEVVSEKAIVLARTLSERIAQEAAIAMNEE